MHASGSYPASGLSEEITSLLLLCRVSAWSLWQSGYNDAPGAVSGGRRRPGWLSPSCDLSSISLWVRTLCMGFPGGGVYRPTPQGYNGNLARRGPSRLSLRSSSSLPTTGARRLAGPADRPDTVAVLLMTLAWSCGHGNCAAVWRAFTVAIPHLVWLMAGGARGRGVGRLQRADSHGPSSGRSCRLLSTH